MYQNLKRGYICMLDSGSFSTLLSEFLKMNMNCFHNNINDVGGWAGVKLCPMGNCD